MRRSYEGRRRRVAKLKARIVSSAEDNFPKCTTPGCSRPTQRAAKAGLSKTLCRACVLRKQRWGSTWCRSPTMKTLRPYIKAALSFIELNRGDPYVNSALGGLSELMETAGPVIIATRVKRLPAHQRAKIALARLRDAGVKAERPLAVALAVHSLIEEAPQVVHRTKEWRVVAEAKAVHRLASGYHRIWEFPDAEGKIHRTELHAYPRSSGQVLRHLGQMIEAPCEWVIHHHLAAVLALKVAGYGPHPAVADPVKFAMTAIAPPPAESHSG